MSRFECHLILTPAFEPDSLRRSFDAASASVASDSRLLAVGTLLSISRRECAYRRYAPGGEISLAPLYLIRREYGMRHLIDVA